MHKENVPPPSPQLEAAAKGVIESKPASRAGIAWQATVGVEGGDQFTVPGTKLSFAVLSTPCHTGACALCRTISARVRTAFSLDPTPPAHARRGARVVLAATT